MPLVVLAQFGRPWVSQLSRIETPMLFGFRVVSLRRQNRVVWDGWETLFGHDIGKGGTMFVEGMWLDMRSINVVGQGRSGIFGR